MQQALQQLIRNKPVGYTIPANLVNIIPFCLSVEAINVLFRGFDGSYCFKGLSLTQLARIQSCLYPG